MNPNPTYDNLRRTLRGGSWYYFVTRELRSGARRNYAPALRYDIVGFRTALAGRLPRV